MKTVHPYEAGVELSVERHLSHEGTPADIVFAVFSTHGLALEIDHRGPTVRMYVHVRRDGTWNRQQGMLAVAREKGPKGNEGAWHAKMLLQMEAMSQVGRDELEVSFPKPLQ